MKKKIKYAVPKVQTLYLFTGDCLHYDTKTADGFNLHSSVSDRMNDWLYIHSGR